MDIFMKACGGVLIAVLLGLTLEKSWKEAAMLLSLCTVCMIGVCAVVYLEPVVELLYSLQRKTGLDGNLLQALIKITGIALITEIAALVCTDSGNAGLGKAVGLLGTAVILCLSVPLIQQLLELAETILGGI